MLGPLLPAIIPHALCPAVDLFFSLFLILYFSAPKNLWAANVSLTGGRCTLQRIQTINATYCQLKEDRRGGYTTIYLRVEINKKMKRPRSIYIQHTFSVIFGAVCGVVCSMRESKSGSFCVCVCAVCV